MFTFNIHKVLLACGLLTWATIAHAVSQYIPPAKRPLPISESAWPKGQYLILNYHGVDDASADQRVLAVRTSALMDQFSWLRDNGFHNISLDDVIQAREGKKQLPERAFLLTFDDGYQSFYTRTFPLLKAYGWHAILAPVGSWLDTPANKSVDFGGIPLARNQILTWKEVREMSQSGLVEIGAHTYDSHKGILADPQGNQQPAATTREYFKDKKRYETRDEFDARMTRDIAKETQRIKEATGKSPRVWVWPYGAANGATLKIAKRFGYQFAFTLGNGLASVNDPMNSPRMLLGQDPNIDQFAQMIQGIRQPEINRVVHVDLDYIYDPNPVQEQHNLDRLIQRMANMRVSTVFLQAYADPKGDGNVRSVYFPNHWLPVREDLFNYVAWQLMTRAHVQVYAWMPVLAFDFKHTNGMFITQEDPKTGKQDIDPNNFKRLSPFNPEARKEILGLYEDLASYTKFNGILFSDDAVMSDFEDDSPDALKAYQQAGFPASISEIRDNPQLFARWTRFKSQALIDFTNEITRHVRDIAGPQIKTARNMYARPILSPESEQWFAQNLNDFLANYDWVVPMAMPYMEGVAPKDADQWLTKLVHTVAQHPGALQKTIFELQARDWNKNGDPWIHSETLARWMNILQSNGVENYGYYPDGVIDNHPVLNTIRPSLSSAWYPLK